MRDPRGFSIIELVIAISLASFVLVGVATIAAQMSRSQAEGIRSGTATGWSLVSYMAMSKEIEDANVLAWPINNGDASDSIVICKNWSRAQDGADKRLNTNTTPAGADSVTVTQYCVDPAVAAAPETGFTLRRLSRSGPAVTCPTPVAAPASCGSTPSAPWGAWTETGVVGFRLEKIPGTYTGSPFVFLRDNTIGGVRLRYVIGRQTPTPNEPIAKFTKFDFGISMQKQFSSTVD